MANHFVFDDWFTIMVLILGLVCWQAIAHGSWDVVLNVLVFLFLLSLCEFTLMRFEEVILLG